MNQKRYAIGLEYDGAKFHGWQIQKGVATVQETLQHALSRVADEPVSVTAAGRTDTGVHATAQVVHFDTSKNRPCRAWLRGANTYIGPGSAVLWVKRVPDTFHARFAACGRYYRYIVLNRKVHSSIHAQRVTWDYRDLDLTRMRVAAEPLRGEHDFSGFRASSCQAKHAIRTISRLTVERSGDWVWFDVEANGFLHHMVRNIVGLLLMIGAGERPVEWARDVLNDRDRSQGGVTAPPAGLYLSGVTYPEAFGIPEAQPPSRFW